MFGMGMAEIAIVWSMFFGGFGIPVGVTPGVEDPYLCQIAPEECYLYVSWSGTQAADPEGNPTEKWIAQKEIRDFWKNLDAENDRMIARAVEPFEEPKDEDKPYKWESPLHELRPLVFRVQKLMYTQPCAMFVNRISEDGFAGNYVFKLGEMEEAVAADLKKLTDEIVRQREWSRETAHGMDVIVANNLVEYQDVEIKAGIHKGYLFVAYSFEGKASFDALFASEKTPEPKWLTEIKDELPVTRRSSIGMVDIGTFLIDMEKAGNELDYNPVREIKKVGFVNGLEADGFVSRATIRTEGELGPIFKMFKGEPLGEKELSGIPADQPISVASRLSSEEIYKTIEELARTVGDKDEFDEGIAGFEGFAGMTLKEDLLDKLDDYAFAYTDLNLVNFSNPPIVVGIGIKDEMAFLDTIAAFSDRIERVVDEDRGLTFLTRKVGDIDVYGVETVRNDAWRNNAWITNSTYFAQHGSQLLISTDFEVLESHIKSREENQDYRSLFDRPDMKKLFAFGNSIGCEGPVAVYSIDLTEFFQNVWPMAGMLLQGQGQERGFNLPKFPTGPVMANGLTPNLSASFRTEKGFQLYQKSVQPASNIPATIAYGMAAALAIQEIF